MSHPGQIQNGYTPVHTSHIATLATSNCADNQTLVLNSQLAKDSEACMVAMEPTLPEVSFTFNNLLMMCTTVLVMMLMMPRRISDLLWTTSPPWFTGGDQPPAENPECGEVATRNHRDSTASFATCVSSPDYGGGGWFLLLEGVCVKDWFAVLKVLVILFSVTNFLLLIILTWIFASNCKAHGRGGFAGAIVGLAVGGGLAYLAILLISLNLTKINTAKTLSYITVLSGVNIYGFLLLLEGMFIAQRHVEATTNAHVAFFGLLVAFFSSWFESLVSLLEYFEVAFYDNMIYKWFVKEGVRFVCVLGVIVYCFLKHGWDYGHNANVLGGFVIGLGFLWLVLYFKFSRDLQSLRRPMYRMLGVVTLCFLWQLTAYFIVFSELSATCHTLQKHKNE
jgi:hypothetical protein